MRFISRRKAKLSLKKVILWVVIVFVVYCIYSKKFPSGDSTWLKVGQFAKSLSPSLYKYFKQKRQAHMMQWFERDAQRDTK